MSLDAQNSDGLTALQVAEEAGDTVIANILRNAGEKAASE